MIVQVFRTRSTKFSTIGRLLVDGIEVVTLEDPPQKTKVYGNTRIPAGRYRMTLRDDGGMTVRYRKRFGDDWHKGMLWIRDIPEFEYVYIHIGNRHQDTLGCILVGMTASQDFIGRSVDAYRQVYPLIRDAILAGEDVMIEIEDEK